MTFPPVLAVAALLLAPLPAAAQIDRTNGWLVQVKPGPKRFFSGDEYDGPGKRRAAYVVAGDQLVALRVQDRFTLVSFVGRKGDTTTGWIESAALMRKPVPRPAPAAWLGRWNAWEAHIAFTPGKRPGTVRAVGSATWGAHDPERVKRGGVNIGDFDAVIRPNGERVSFSPFMGCSVTLRLLGPYLLGSDNGGCGGHNVTFGGVYRR